MATFHRQGITIFLIQKDISHLSLIIVQAGGYFFDMHHLVQLATRKWLEVDHSTQRWRTMAVESIPERLPVGKSEYWEYCRVLLLHADELPNFTGITEHRQTPMVMGNLGLTYDPPEIV